MITELNLSLTGQAVAILFLLGLLWLVLGYRPTRINVDEPKADGVTSSDPIELNPDYGRYIWLAGRYYS